MFIYCLIKGISNVTLLDIILIDSLVACIISMLMMLYYLLLRLGGFR